MCCRKVFLTNALFWYEEGREGKVFLRTDIPRGRRPPISCLVQLEGRERNELNFLEFLLYSYTLLPYDKTITGEIISVALQTTKVSSSLHISSHFCERRVFRPWREKYTTIITSIPVAPLSKKGNCHLFSVFTSTLPPLRLSNSPPLPTLHFTSYYMQCN